MVLFDRQGPTDQDGENEEQTMASAHAQHCLASNPLLYGNLDSRFEERLMPRVARLHAILWGVFSMGGFIAAFLLPVLIYLVGIAYPLGLWPMANTDPTSAILNHHHLGTLFLFVTVAGSLYHGIFRFQSTLTEVGLARAKRALEAIGYLIIIIGILATAIYLLQYNPGVLSLP